MAQAVYATGDLLHSRVLAIFPWQDIAATVRHFKAGPGGGSLELID